MRKAHLFRRAICRRQIAPAQGGGLEDEDEDIEILEPTLDEALAMIDKGEIVDAKTILLLHYADAPVSCAAMTFRPAQATRP